MLPETRRAPLVEGEERTPGRVRSGVEEGLGEADAYRCPVGVPGEDEDHG